MIRVLDGGDLPVQLVDEVGRSLGYVRRVDALARTRQETADRRLEVRVVDASTGVVIADVAPPSRLVH